MDKKDEKESSVKEEAALKMVDFSTDSKSPMHHEKFSEWEELSRETEQIRELSLEERQTVTNKTSAVYRDLETFLRSSEYNEDLRKELQKSNPDYHNVLSKRIKDLQKSDHGLVVSGETSAGKSTLINKILGKRIFKGKILESTSTICKIRNSDNIRVITEKVSGEREEQDFTGECDLDTEEGVEMLRDFLEKRTDLTCMSSDENIRCVDIGFPIHFLKANTILVDTPGIGGSGEVTHKLKEYLPNALSFIFVINASSAGGMQEDRLPEILEELIKLVLNSEMPCFHPESVIFLTNKWDLVELQAEDEEEVPQVWERLKSDLQRRWPSVREEHIFRLNLKEVSVGKRNASTKTFEDFLKVLESMSKRAKNLRILHHLRFLQTILRNVSKGLDARIELVNMSEAEQSMLIKEHQEKVEMITHKCREFKEDYLQKTKDTIEIVVQECERFMSTSGGKYDILNPTGRERIANVNWNKTNFEKEISARVDMYVVEYLQSDNVLEKFKKIAEEINDFRQKIISSLEQMESEWARLKPNVEETESSTFLIQLGLLTSPVWIAALAFGLGLPAAVFGGLLFVFSSFLGLVTKTSKDIDDEYYKCIKAVPKRMYILLENKCGSNISTMIKKVTKELLQHIEALKERLNQISEKRIQILENREVLLDLDTKINTMERFVIQLREDLNS